MASLVALDALPRPSILLPTHTPYAASLSSSPGSATSSASASSSHTSLSAHSPAATPKAPTPTPLSARRIRFAPLPDPRREVLITDDGNELPIGPLPDVNTFPTSRLLPTTPSILVQSPTAPKSALAASDPVPPVLGPPHADDPTAYSSSSSSTSTHSYVSSASSSASASAASTPRTTTPSEYSPVSSVGSSPVTLTSALPAKNGDSLSQAGPSSTSAPPSRPENGYPASAAATTSSSAASFPKPRSLSLLRRPFKKASTSSSGSSSHSLTPTPSIDSSAPKSNGHGHAHIARKALSYSTEEILTLGTINLFRTSSRESNDSATTPTAGWGLSRWSSAGSGNGKDSALFSGSPLARTQSTQSYKSRSKSLFGSLSSGSTSTSSLSDGKSKASAAAPSASATPRAAKPSPLVNRHKGTRMLNGRVYGSKRAANANLFASARDEEPEFVEWGYGGMGSVKGAKSAGVGGSAGGVNWARLQGGNGAGSPAAVEDEDDGSGMGWVKRRKEERERKAKEEKERLEKEQKAQEETLLNGEKVVSEPEQTEEKDKEKEEPSGSGMSTPTPKRSSTMDGGFSALGSASAPVASPTSPTSLLASGASSPVPAPADAPPAEAAAFASPFSALALGQNPHDEPGPILVPAPVDEMSAFAEFESHSGAPTPCAALMNGFAFGGGDEATIKQEHVPDVVPVPVRPRHHHSHSHARTLSRTVSLVSPTDEKSMDGALASAEALASVAESGAARGEGEGEVPRSPLSSSSESESESDVDGERNDDGNDSNEEEEDGDEDEEDEETEADVARKTMLGAGVEKVMWHKDKE